MSSIEKIFQMGETIIKEGRFSNSFYIIKQGMVEVVKQKGDREVQLCQLGPNEFFGEMSLLDPEVQKHDATIRAVEETKVIIMSAYGSREIEKEAYEKGAYFYFDKPINLWVLNSRLKDIGIQNDILS